MELFRLDPVLDDPRLGGPPPPRGVKPSFMDIVDGSDEIRREEAESSTGQDLGAGEMGKKERREMGGR